MNTQALTVDEKETIIVKYCCSYYLKENNFTLSQYVKATDGRVNTPQWFEK